jgi:hypothetical protein
MRKLPVDLVDSVDSAEVKGMITDQQYLSTPKGDKKHLLMTW